MGAFLVLSSIILGKLFSYLYIVLVAVKLGSQEYGLLSLGMATLSLFSAFSLLGLDEGVLRFIPFYKGKNDQKLLKSTIMTSLKTVLNSSLFFSILIIVFSGFISDKIFNEYELEKVLLFMAIALPFSAVSNIFLVSFRAFQKPQYEILFKELIEKPLRLIITFILIYLGFKLTGALIGFVLAIMIMLALILITFNKKIFNVFSPDIQQENKRELLNYSLPLMLKNLVWIIIPWVNLLMIGYFNATSDVGIYNVALPTANLIIIPVYGIMYLFLPIISGLYGKNNNEEIKEIYKKISKYSLLLIMPVFLIISMLSKDIISSLFGVDYLSATLPLTILSFGYLVFSLSDISMNMLSVLKKTKTIFSIIFGFGLTNILLNFLLIPKYNILGASIATSVSFLIGAVLMIVISNYHTKLHPFMFSYSKILISSIITIVLTLAIKNKISFSPMINLVVFAAIILSVYSFLVFVFRILEKEDIELLMMIKRKFIK